MMVRFDCNLKYYVREYTDLEVFNLIVKIYHTQK